MASESPFSAYLTGGVAVLALMGNVAMFVWQGGRSDVTALEGRLERSNSQIEHQIEELKRNDELHLRKDVHLEFKDQIERQVVRNTNVIDDLLLKKEVFDKELAAQKSREDLVRAQHDKDLEMLRGRMTMLRQHIDEIEKYLRDHK